MGLSQVEIERIKQINDVATASNYLFEQIPSSQTLQKALEYSQQAHISQTRKSGEPYIVHPILVASIVASITNDESMAISALLHDVVEDTDITIEEVQTLFGKDIAHLVEGLTKIDSIRDSELVALKMSEF